MLASFQADSNLCRKDIEQQSFILAVLLLDHLRLLTNTLCHGIESVGEDSEFILPFPLDLRSQVTGCHLRRGTHQSIDRTQDLARHEPRTYRSHQQKARAPP